MQNWTAKKIALPVGLPWWPFVLSGYCAINSSPLTISPAALCPCGDSGGLGPCTSISLCTVPPSGNVCISVIKAALHHLSLPPQLHHCALGTACCLETQAPGSRRLNQMTCEASLWPKHPACSYNLTMGAISWLPTLPLHEKGFIKNSH